MSDNTNPIWCTIRDMPVNEKPSAHDSLKIPEQHSRQQNVGVSDIEEALDDLWECQEGTAKIRACLFNLIVYCQERTTIDYMRAVVQKVIARFPCRIIFIEGDTTADEEYLRTNVAAAITGKGDTQIACDSITIEAAGANLARVPFLILPHIVPDLPVYLVWGQDPTTDNAILPHLERYATRLIFDSETTTDLQKFSTRLLQRLHSGTRDIIDMNWARISGWRAGVAHIFSSPDKILQLASTKAMTVTFNSCATDYFQHNDFQALYLQAWIAAQLNWKVVGCKHVELERIITYTNGLQETTVTITPVCDKELPPGNLIAIDITTHDKYHYAIKRCKAMRSVCVEESSPKQCALPVTIPLSSLERDLHFMKEIFYEPTSAHYRKMLEQITHYDLET